MRDRDGRRGRAPRQLTRIVILLALAIATSGPAWPVAVLDSQRTATRWLVVSVAADTGCAVLDDGRTRRLLCAGEFLAGHRTRLLRIDSGGAVFELASGAAAPLQARIATGEILDPEALRARMDESTGPRPGWIELPPDDGAPTPPENLP